MVAKKARLKANASSTQESINQSKYIPRWFVRISIVYALFSIISSAIIMAVPALGIIYSIFWMPISAVFLLLNIILGFVIVSRKYDLRTVSLPIIYVFSYFFNFSAVFMFILYARSSGLGVEEVLALPAVFFVSILFPLASIIVSWYLLKIK